MPPPPCFHIVGDAFVDFFCYLQGDWPESGGDSLLDQPVVSYAGGSSVNTATHLKALVDSLYVPRKDEAEAVPKVVLQTVLNENDHYGQILLHHCENHELNFINCNKDTASSTGHCVAIVSQGERSFMTHRGCVENFDASDLNIDEMIREEQDLHLHVAGFFNMKGFWHGKLKDELARIRTGREKRDAKGRGRLSVSLVTQNDGSNAWDGSIDELIPLVDMLIMNEIEAEKILARGRKGRGEAEPVLAVANPTEDWVDFFSSLSATTLFVVTRGASGAVAFYDGKILAAVDPAIEVKVVDPTGAGDSFTAGFLYGAFLSADDSQQQEHRGEEREYTTIGRRWSRDAIQRGLLWGCAVGTASVTIRGASIPPEIQNVKDIYERENAKRK